MTISKYYRNSTFYPSLLVILGTTIFSSVSYGGYKSGWLTKEPITVLSFVIAFAYCLLMSFLCLPIFLVRLEIVKNNQLLTLLSWLLLPLLCALITCVYSINPEDKESTGEEFVYMVILNLPFVAGLLGSYFDYRKRFRPGIK